MSDDEISRRRDEIREIDRAIVAALNRRIELVRDLWRYKEQQGIGSIDPRREEELLDERVRENPGPLSEAGLRAFYLELLALVKRELGT